MLLMIALIIGLLFYFGPGPGIVLGLALVIVGATASALVSAVVFRVTGHPAKPGSIPGRSS
jgi:hypothetical protein